VAGGPVAAGFGQAPFTLTIPAADLFHTSPTYAGLPGGVPAGFPANVQLDLFHVRDVLETLRSKGGVWW
jgi:hypothetical protein